MSWGTLPGADFGLLLSPVGKRRCQTVRHRQLVEAGDIAGFDVGISDWDQQLPLCVGVEDEGERLDERLNTPATVVGGQCAVEHVPFPLRELRVNALAQAAGAHCVGVVDGRRQSPSQRAGHFGGRVHSTTNARDGAACIA